MDIFLKVEVLISNKSIYSYDKKKFIIYVILLCYLAKCVIYVKFNLIKEAIHFYANWHGSG